MADPTTGTTDSASGTTASAAGGSTVAADGSAEDFKAQLEEERRKNAQLLSEKSAVEESRREVDELRRQAEARAAQNTSSPGGYDANQIAAETLRLAAEGDVMAQALVLSAREQSARDARLRHEWEMEKIPEADRSEVEKLAEAARVAPSVAHLMLKGKRYDTEQGKMTKEREHLAEAQRKREDDVVETTVSTVSAADMKGRIYKQSDYEATLTRLGPKSPEAQELKRKADKGLITVKWGE